MGKKEMKKFVSLNDDILFGVLSQFPTKDLLVLSRVSKGWRHLISDCNFIRVQSQRKEPLSGFFFQQRYQLCEEDMKTISYVPAKKEGIELQQNVLDFLPQDVVVLTACNGLVCCRCCFPFEEPAIYVCNPLRKEWITLDWPEPDKISSIALAYDPLKDFSHSSTNFKVVRVLPSETDNENAYFCFYVYSSETRNWKLSKEICWCSNNLYKNNGIFIRGILHWLTDGDQILSFYVENEAAWLISIPVPTKEFISTPQACIGESEDQLHYVTVSEHGIHVWSLDDYFESKWSLKYSRTLAEMEHDHSQVLINLYDKVIKKLTILDTPWMDPLAFKDGVLVLRVAATIYLYRIEKSEMEVVSDISKFGTSSMFCPFALPYSMSLVPLYQSDKSRGHLV